MISMTNLQPSPALPSTSSAGGATAANTANTANAVIVAEGHGLSAAHPALAKNKPFRLLLAAYTLSLFGNSFHGIALSLWVLQETGSAKQMTVLLVTNLIVSSLLGSVAGTIADRMNRRQLMLIADLTRCVLVLAIALCIAAPGVPFALVVGLTGLVTVAGLFQSPAFQASLVTIVGREQIQKATGTVNIADNVARTAGFAMGGVFVAAAGGVWAIAFDGVMFLLSFLLILLAGPFPEPERERERKPKPDPDPSSDSRSSAEERRSFRADFAAGIQYISRNGFAKAVTVLLPALTLFFMAASMLTQVMAVNIWKASPVQFGLIEACIPLGYMIGAGLIVAFGSKLRRRGWLVMIHLLGMGPTYVALSFAGDATAAIPLILLIGFQFSFCMLLINIILRLEVSEALQGRVFGTLGSLMSVAPPLGLAVASYFADLHGADTVMLVVGGLLLAFGVGAALKLKDIRQYR
jgi:DHA3 family macrolide efflux protein-like MFS transporter